MKGWWAATPGLFLSAASKVSPVLYLVQVFPTALGTSAPVGPGLQLGRQKSIKRDSSCMYASTAAVRRPIESGSEVPQTCTFCGLGLSDVTHQATLLTFFITTCPSGLRTWMNYAGALRRLGMQSRGLATGLQGLGKHYGVLLQDLHRQKS